MKEIYEIKEEAKKFREKSEEDFAILVKKFKVRSRQEPLKNFLIEWFALVQEASFRTTGLRHFDTQLLAGLLLHEGKIVEMKTGEGKTLASTLPIALNALSNRGVHVVTVNEYLAERDQKFMGKIYAKLDLTTGLVKNTSTLSEKQKAYNSEITYLTNSELVFDYLRDSSALSMNEIVQRPLNFCLIDEIDSILIDEARTPLILSTPAPISEGKMKKLSLATEIGNKLEVGLHFEIDEKRKDVYFTDFGSKEIARRIGVETLFSLTDPWASDILNALKAKYLFHAKKDYIVLNNKVVIVDEFTGRIMEDRRWGMGLHESIERKEQVPVREGTKTKSSITYQNFFNSYPILSGMSGTAKTTEKEFQDIYNLEVCVLPTVKPFIRKDLPDFLYQTELAKWKSVLALSKSCYEKGQPILIGTSTIKNSEFLSDLFRSSNIPHKVLNAKPENVARESEIIAQAGERFAVTIATNMAGRGTDILLGGNPIFKMKQKLYESLKKKKHKFSTKAKEELKRQIEDLPTSLKDCESSLKTISKNLKDLEGRTFSNWEKENELVKSLGGLFVLGTERHETRRIDDQLRGRAGRLGDPGQTQFFVSLEDELLKIFGGEKIRRWINFLNPEKDTALESAFLTTSLEKAQKKVEQYNYELRKNVFEYDDILNVQRKQFFEARKEILSGKLLEHLILRLNEKTFQKLLKEHEKTFIVFSAEKKLDFFASSTFLKHGKKDGLFGRQKKKNNKLLLKEIWIQNDLQRCKTNFYQLGLLKKTRKILRFYDLFWMDHIERMSYIRETIHWRSYGQQNPLVEYNMEAAKSFKDILEQIRAYVLYSFLSHPLNYKEL